MLDEKGDEKSEDKEVGGIKLLAKSKMFLDPEEPKEKVIKQTKPDLLAHRKVSSLVIKLKSTSTVQLRPDLRLFV